MIVNGLEVIENPTPIERWGKDHWSTLAYIETVVVDRDGWVQDPKMRARGAYPTRLKPSEGAILAAEAAKARQVAGEAVPDELTVIPTSEDLHMHGDWDCVADMVAYGLVVPVGDVPDKLINGRVLNRLCFQRRARMELTDRGLMVAAALRAHKARGGSFHHFVAPPFEAEVAA